MPFVNFRKKIPLLFLRFSPEFWYSNISAVTEHTRNQIFLKRYPNFFFFKIFTLVLSDTFLDGFSKFWFFIGEICILIRDFWVIFESYSMRIAYAEHTQKRFYRMLSIRGTNFIACWAYEVQISMHAQPAVKCEHFYMYNLCWTYAELYRTLSIRGTNFIACWAYWEPILSHAEHARKCLKVEYLGWMKYDFQKSRVTGPWDHKVSVSAKKVNKKNFMLVYL